jgi:predicted metal-binding membrane protein
MTLADKYLSGATLIAAGLYQWTPMKDRCLAQCQSPLSFIQRHGGFDSGAVGSLRLGVEHGLYCVGCCWLLMALLFVGGVMNLLWILGLMAVVLAEKIIPAHYLSRVFGVAATAAGIWMMAR